MRRLLAIALLVGSASAGTYDDYSRGLDANNHGYADAAIDFFTRSIEGGDLAASYLPSAHLGRARALLHNGRCTFAHADLTDAIRLRPDFVDAYSLRAEVNQCLDRGDAALADATAAIGLRPAAGYYFTRARVLWGMGEFEQASADAKLAAAHDPGNGYFLLWRELTSLRTEARSAAVAVPDAIAGWPRPLLDLFAGHASPEGVWRTARNANEKCEADFYIGEWRLARGDAVTARTLFQTAVRDCPRDFIAFDAARRELKRMGG